jgi:hypothetical protein
MALASESPDFVDKRSIAWTLLILSMIWDKCSCLHMMEDQNPVLTQ